ncbi:MAG TPA: DUF6550 family protein [Clostridia bacterium]|nr:DUF6550 family protein [Clostridia bacterium]
MKKDYTVKKKAVITTLSLAAVCLAGGLFYYINTIGGQPPEAFTESLPPANVEVVLPDFEPETSQGDSTTSGAISPEKPSEAPSQSMLTNDETQGQISKPSDGKPKSPSEAIPPSSPPPAATDNNTAPASEPNQEQPQGGDKKDGKIFVPGFGWIEDEGGGSTVKEAPNAGTGDPIGNM